MTREIHPTLMHEDRTVVTDEPAEICHKYLYFCDMSRGSAKSIESRIGELEPGTVILPSDFKDLGTSTAVRKAFSRLTALKTIVRMGHGVYAIPRKHPELGMLLPSLEDVAKAVAEKERVVIRPTGQYALNRLGLSTQVPMRLTYLTSGHSKQIRIGQRTIVFKSTSARKLSMKGAVSSLLLLALEEIELEGIRGYMSDRIRELLEKEEDENLRHDLRQTSARISDFIIRNYLRTSR